MTNRLAPILSMVDHPLATGLQQEISRLCAGNVALVRLVTMTTNLLLKLDGAVTDISPVTNAYELPLADEPTGAEEVRQIAGSLDRMRTVCADVGVATLLAEIQEVDSDVVCDVLDEITRVAERAVASLLRARTRA